VKKIIVEQRIEYIVRYKNEEDLQAALRRLGKEAPITTSVTGSKKYSIYRINIEIANKEKYRGVK